MTQLGRATREKIMSASECKAKGACTMQKINYLGSSETGVRYAARESRKMIYFIGAFKSRKSFLHVPLHIAAGRSD